MAETSLTESETLRLEVVPEPPQVELSPEVRNALVSHSMVRAHLPNADLWVVGLDAYDKETEEEPQFTAVLADMSGSGVVEAEGSLWSPDSILMWTTDRHRLPHDDEHAWALGVLKMDKELGPRLESGEVETYRPMPPLASTLDADGSVVRAVSVGLRETGADGQPVHSLVAVQSAYGDIVEVRPPVTGETGESEGPRPEAPHGAPFLESQARVRVFRGEEVLWQFVAVRPSSSTGGNGSGLELRFVDYQRVRVLHRAHVPILTVRYDDGETVRSWLNEESWFAAEGGPRGDGDPVDPVPGYRVCSSPPRLDGPGDFRGVALWLDGDDVVVGSRMEAGWHRYVCEWRLSADGTIRPRLRFGAVRNPRTSSSHTHHAYWRFDFDVATAEQNQIQEHNDPTLPGQLARWHTIRYETSRRRDPEHQRQWRVKTVKSPHGYAVVPGPHDGTADDYGAGDVWVVAYHPDEVDDGEGVSSDPYRSRAQVDRHVSGELVERADVVLWYAAHVSGEDGPAVGPDLVPFNWRPRVEREAYEPLVPPPIKGVDDDDEDDDEAPPAPPPAPPVDFPIE
jgi:hypothetical protein